MPQTLDFNKIKKSSLTITLPDDDHTKLLLMTPTKKLLTELQETYLSDHDTVGEDLEALYQLTAKLMSRNKAGISVTADQLSELLDSEDIAIFFDAYTDFVKNFANQKN